MDPLTLPKILNIPEKFYPLLQEFEKYRYFLLKGGRGGGKSQAVGRFFLYLCGKYNIRAVCGRETQNSINESVYSLLADLIREHQLNFEIQASKITARAKKSDIAFRGFREQGAFNIQGMEGIDLLWIDESQALRKQTIDVLIPTIRKENAKIIFSMNPHVHNDPIVEMLKGRSDCLVIDINYDANKFCPAALKKEANECRKRSEKDYQHIWMGVPLDQGDDALFSLDHFATGTRNAHILAKGYGLRVAGYDIARFGDDKCACVILQQMGALHWEEIFCDEWEHKDLNYTTGRILTTTNKYNVDLAAIDEDGLGSGPFDTLTKGRKLDYFVGFRNPPFSYQHNKSYGNNRTLHAYTARDLLMDGHLNIKTKSVIDECLTIKYTFDNQQRRILVSKKDMKKQGIPSPNLADATIMAVSLIGQVKERQARQYQPDTVDHYSTEDNLFKIAGVH